MILGFSAVGTTLFSIIVFLIIILLLVVMLLVARDKLSPKGDVTLHINDRELVVSPGSNLLIDSFGQWYISSFSMRRRRNLWNVQMPDSGGRRINITY